MNNAMSIKYYLTNPGRQNFFLYLAQKKVALMTAVLTACNFVCNQCAAAC